MHQNSRSGRRLGASDCSMQSQFVQLSAELQARTYKLVPVCADLGTEIAIFKTIG
jgi:hypothetical protein